MKIFEFQINGEREWVAANTVIHAIKVHTSTCSLELFDYEDEDDIKEVPESEWEKLKVINEDDGIEQTFKQWMKDHTQPDIIASTAY